METVEKARFCLKMIKEKKGIDPALFQVGSLTSLTDYFLIASGKSSRQVQAMTRHLRRAMREKGFRAYGVEGEREGHWVLMDYGDIIIHLFYEPVREFYDLEGLWIEAPKVDLNENGA